ncbi:MAG: FTR1 family protein [Methylovirgula sp.]
MFAALIIVFREVVEAGLVVGVVLAVTQNVPGRLQYVFGGVAAGIGGAGIVALFTGLIAEALAGSGQEVLNASVLGIAVVMLTWHNVWMARHGREMTQELSDFSQQVSSGSNRFSLSPSSLPWRCCARVRRSYCFCMACWSPVARPC